MTQHERKRKVLLFVLMGICIYYVVFFLLSLPNRSQAIMIRDFYKQDSNIIDVVCIGSSNIYASYNSALAFHEYGIAAYDFACGALPFGATEYLIKESEKTQNPYLYVVNLNSIYYENVDTARVSNLLLAMPLSKNKIDATRSLLSNSQDEAALVDYIVGFPIVHTAWTSLLNLREQVSNTDGLNSRDVFKGYYNEWGDADDWEITHNVDTDNFTSDVSKIEDWQEKDLRELCEYCLSNDIPLLFVTPPTKHDEPFYRKLNYAYKIIEEYRINCFKGDDAIRIGSLESKYYWFDNGHLNSFGATQYTRVLSEYIRSNYEIPDRRTDEQYQEWEDCYQRFDETMWGLSDLFVHYIDCVCDKKARSTVYITNSYLSQGETEIIKRDLGIDIKRNCDYSLNIINGKLQNYNEHMIDHYNDDSSTITCTTFDQYGNYMFADVFYYDLERNVMRKNIKPEKNKAYGFDGETFGKKWVKETLLEDISYHRNDILEDLAFCCGDDYVVIDCVWALIGESCDNQAIYLEITNDMKECSIWEMNAVVRQDWADLLGNQLYTNGGASVSIPYDELPIGDYSVRLFGRHNDVIYFSNKSWKISVYH